MIIDRHEWDERIHDMGGFAFAAKTSRLRNGLIEGNVKKGVEGMS